MPYVFDGNQLKIDAKFKNGGFISKAEYEITNKKNGTYLSNGLEYWTSTQSSSGKHFVINYKVEEKFNSDKTGVRITEYADPDVGISGVGSNADPWVFNEILRLHITSTNKTMGLISTEPCSNATAKTDTVTLLFSNGNTNDLYFCPYDGYKVFKNSCSGYMIKTVEKKFNPFNEEMVKDYSEVVLLMSYITYQYGNSLSDELKKKSSKIL